MYPWKHPSAIQNSLHHVLARRGHKAASQRQSIQWLDFYSCEGVFNRLLIDLIDYLILSGMKNLPWAHWPTFTKVKDCAQWISKLVIPQIMAPRLSVSASICMQMLFCLCSDLRGGKGNVIMLSIHPIVCPSPPATLNLWRILSNFDIAKETSQMVQWILWKKKKKLWVSALKQLLW